MRHFKAPALDGLSPCLFQRYRYILGEKITSSVHDIFRTSKLVVGLNETLICLILKGDVPKILT